MNDAAEKVQLPPEIADAMEAIGEKPDMPTLVSILANFAKDRAARDVAAGYDPDELPLRQVLPDWTWYEPARRACDEGRL